MKKVIRKAYPLEVSIGLLLMILFVSFFLSRMLFIMPVGAKEVGPNLYLGMFLASASVLITVLILVEEFLFPTKIKEIDGGVLFRNHSTKLKMQWFIYLCIPVAFTFIYLTYDVNIIRFSVWAAICILAPIVGKLVSGLHNYKDFLKLTPEVIAYKDNEKEGNMPMASIEGLRILKDESKFLQKLEISLKDGRQVVIDIDKMELDDFLEAIEQYITTQYSKVLKHSDA
jgi:hypothetical protein